MNTATEIIPATCGTCDSRLSTVVPFPKKPDHPACLIKDIAYAVIEARPSFDDRTIVHEVLDQCMTMVGPMTRKDIFISSLLGVVATVSLFGFSFLA